MPSDSDEGVCGTLVLDDRGLHLPGAYRGLEGQFTVKTPSGTVRVNRLSPGTNVWPLVTGSSFGVTADEAYNPELAPDRVRLKCDGEEATVWRVVDQTTDDEQEGDR
jgi:hypothetical protein